MSNYKQRLLELAELCRIELPTPTDLDELGITKDTAWEYRHEQTVDELIMLINKLEEVEDE